jgi:hypothetical protein
MTPGAVRAVVIPVCVAGIGGMIAGSIADNNALAMTFGLMAAVAALCLIVATAVSRGSTPPTGASGAPGESAGEQVGEEVGEEVEARIAELVGQGADEGVVRGLVQAAVRLGRGMPQTGR